MIYDQKVFWKSLLTIIGVMVLMKVTGGAGFALVVPLAFGAFFKKKPEEVLFWALVTIVMLIGNPRLMPKDQIFMLVQRGMLMSFGLLMLLQLTGGQTSFLMTPFKLLFLYLIFEIIPSAVGWQPIISFLKLFLFVVIYVAFFGIANQVVKMSRANMAKIRGMLLAVLSFLVIGSVLLLPVPAIGQMDQNAFIVALQKGQALKSLFMGMANHSQALGPIVTMIAVFVFADWSLAVRRFSKLHALILACCPYLVYKTSSRTAMASFIIGMLVTSFCIVRERGIGVRWRAKIKSMVFFFLAFCAVAVVATPSLRNKITRFALKSNTEVTTQDFTTEGILSSRQGLMDLAMSNFKKSPVIGNGFQVSMNMEERKIKSWKELLSAPVEKGVWVTAVLEEGGVIGMLLFCCFLIFAGCQFLVHRAYITLSLLLTFTCLNLGEFTFFSMSYSGGFGWLFIFVGIAFDALRLRDDYMKQQYGDYE